MDISKLFSTFSLGDLSFAIDVAHVQEVMRDLEITRVPLAPRSIRGLINLRGQIITAIDARSCLGLAPRPETQSCIYLILRAQGDLISLLVDDVGDVVEFAEEEFESRPATLKGRLREVVSGAYRLPGNLLLVLDIQRLLSEPSGEPTSTLDQAQFMN
jgi:purine-binding chemotaxis protein CheW